MYRFIAQVATLLLLACLSLGCAAQAVTPETIPESVIQAEAAAMKNDHPSPCTHACYVLSSKMPSRISLSPMTVNDYWDMKQSTIQPTCRVEPESAQDVSTIIKTLTDSMCHFAIKGGGHGREAYISSTDGVLIDLVRLSEVKISKDRKSVSVGAGNKWLKVYKALEAENLMVLGGRVADVGVGGLTLGGGISFYTNQYGWVCDSVLSFEIVLPDGTMKNVTHKSAPDLYKALRGAGQTNFGVVTSFTYETFEPPQKNGMLWDTNKMYTWDKLGTLVKLHHDYIQSPTEVIEPTGGFFAYGFSGDYNMWLIQDRYVHSTHNNNDTFPKVFAPFNAVEAVEHTETRTLRPYSEITEEIKLLSPYGFRNAYATFTFRPSEALMLSILKLHKGVVEQANLGGEGVIAVIVFQLFSANARSHMTKRGGSAYSMNMDANGPLVITNLAWRWIHGADDEKMMNALNDFVKKAENKAKSQKAWHPFKYINYAHPGQDVLEGYGKGGVEWLRKVQKEVDPKGSFTRAGLNKGAFDLYQDTAASKEEIRDEL